MFSFFLHLAIDVMHQVKHCIAVLTTTVKK